ncbi:hypothetical protein HFP15_22220 [Amycolatopsis sp. K13G38]|uniref:Uncharacterized protein n=1 Tax=Amycolatopsis acididurans TaxID=2724524 RepID=A0ABX1J767_9PSEU|nr:hypothetical protein [Amycolatopsis acididurans]NKQ55603.1 hypothetical protein [Amycolatopsis acididurans]
MTAKKAHQRTVARKDQRSSDTLTRTGASIATHRELGELLAQLQRAAKIDA